MAVLDAKKTYRNLLKKGFSSSESHSDDHKYLEFFHNDELILYTKISHGADDLGDFLIKQMSHQCKLNKLQFLDLARCPMSEEEYIEALKLQGLIE